MILIEDCGQKIHQHTIKNNYWKSQGIEAVRYPVASGDYILMNDKIKDVLDRKRKRNLEVKKMDTLGCFSISVDTKMDLMELYGCMVQSHERFRDELLLAQNNNIKLYILTENKNDVRKIEDLVFWDNPRKYIWMAEVRKVFTDLQKKWYSDENAIKFFTNKNIPIPNKDIQKVYFKQLKEIPLDDILAYLKNKKVVAYLKENKIKVRKKPMDNNSLIKSMQEMELKYGVTFLFCSPEESGKMVIELLNGNE